jgi:tRNA (guanosine-2'-O-)-methyltransferase
MEYVSAEEMFELVHGRRTDDPEWFRFADAVIAPDAIVSILAPQISASRKDTVKRVLANRTDNLTVVVEGMIDLGNVSAVMRTADGFGVQSVHAIDTADVYKRSRRTTRGTDKWIDRYRWEDAESCFGYLRSADYRIVVADIADGAVPIGDADLTQRSAFVFGNELEGVSEVARSMANMAVTIPMAVFADSFNISVADALTLFEAQRQRTRRFGRNGDLSDSDMARIRAVWYMKSVRESRLHIERALASGHGSTGIE